jgi:hypothetical protein
MESLKRADKLRDEYDEYAQTVECVEYLGLSADDDSWVIQVVCRMNCIDCAAVFDREHYMVWDHIWEQAGLKPLDYCCRECLSLRLKRPLGPSDWLPCLLNYKQGLIRHPRSILRRRRRRMAEWITGRRPLNLGRFWTLPDSAVNWREAYPQGGLERACLDFRGRGFVARVCAADERSSTNLQLR